MAVLGGCGRARRGHRGNMRRVSYVTLHSFLSPHTPHPTPPRQVLLANVIIIPLVSLPGALSRVPCSRRVVQGRRVRGVYVVENAGSGMLEPSHADRS